MHKKEGHQPQVEEKEEESIISESEKSDEVKSEGEQGQLRKRFVKKNLKQEEKQEEVKVEEKVEEKECEVQEEPVKEDKIQIESESERNSDGFEVDPDDVQFSFPGK